MTNEEPLVMNDLKFEEVSIYSRHYCPIGQRHDHLSTCSQDIYEFEVHRRQPPISEIPSEKVYQSQKKIIIYI